MSKELVYRKLALSEFDFSLEHIQNELAENMKKPLDEQVGQFETLAETMFNRHCHAVNSATSGLHLALKALGIGPGDHVICSSFTFVASANPILYTGAEPVFVDVEYVTWNMDPKLLEQALATLARGGRPCRAVIIPHIYGMPGKIKELMEICAYYKVPVIEDAAQAFGAQYNNKPVGSFGDIAVFSFNNNKIFSLMGGGLIVSNDKKILNRTKYFATQAKKNGSYYLHEDVGFNYKISPILASIGCCLWKSWPLYVEGRRRVFNSYYQRLNRWPLIQFQNEPSGHVSNRWLTVIILNWDMPIDVLPNLLYKLQEENIETRRLWKPLPEQPLFNGTRFFSNGNSRRLFETGVCLPSSASLRNSQIERICTLVEKYLF